MKIYFVVGESSAYAERLKWNVDAWMERPLAAARATQLEALVKQLGWPAPLGSFFTDTNFRMMITGLNTAEDGDPNAAWNGNVQWIDYTVEEIELHLTRGAVGEDGGF